ncbi:hypothetical protein ACRAWD_28030, partial [Caulobacter segnis]
DHPLTTHLEYEVTDFQRDSDAVTRNTPGATVYEHIGLGVDQERANFKLDYSKPLPKDVKLKTGLDFELSGNDFTNSAQRRRSGRSGDRSGPHQPLPLYTRTSTPPTSPMSGRSATSRCRAACGPSRSRST